MKATFTELLRQSKMTDALIFVIGGSLFAVIVGCFFVSPAYEKGASIGLLAFSNAFSGALAFKFGITIPAGGSSNGKPQVTCPKCGHEFDPDAYTWGAGNQSEKP